MNQPNQPVPPPRPQPQSLLSEAVEQAADTARFVLNRLEAFAEDEAEALATRRYGLAELATAPVRLFSILVGSAITATSTASDNLALLSLNGHVGTRTASRAFTVWVSETDLRVAGVAVRSSDLVGRQHRYRIPLKQIRLDPAGLAGQGVVRVDVRSGLAPPDTYAGTLFFAVDQKTVQKNFLVAIVELGVPET